MLNILRSFHHTYIFWVNFFLMWGKGNLDTGACPSLSGRDMLKYSLDANLRPIKLTTYLQTFRFDDKSEYRT